MPTCFVIMGFGVKTDYRTSRVLDLDKAYLSGVNYLVRFGDNYPGRF